MLSVVMGAKQDEGMGYLSDGLGLVLCPNSLHAIWHFDRDLTVADGHMQSACRSFFDWLGYQIAIDRPWNHGSGGILWISDHDSALDGFAMSLACPDSLKLRRVIFSLTARCLGRRVARESILVWPRGNYQNLCFHTRGFVDRVSYLISHRWGPWVKPKRALNRICSSLSAGESVTLLPSGTVGERRWRSGVGAIVMECLRRHPTQNYYLAPVYLEFARKDRCLRIETPLLISFRQLLEQLGRPTDRTALTQEIQSMYRQRKWPFKRR